MSGAVDETALESLDSKLGRDANFIGLVFEELVERNGQDFCLDHLVLRGEEQRFRGRGSFGV